ncbi:MAG: hypothetical protein ACUVWX_03505 [Kiritimatiellia bacterium]
MIELQDCVVVTGPSPEPCESNAIHVLVEELAKRTGIVWEVIPVMPGQGVLTCENQSRPNTAGNLTIAQRTPVLIGTGKSLGGLIEPFHGALAGLSPPRAEGFQLAWTEKPHRALVLLGADARGVLYGIGRLLRCLDLGIGKIGLREPLRLSSSPRFAVRGHQLGYRPLNNTYDAWTPEQFEQYIRELALFGANTIELVPPGADDSSPTAPHMKLDPLEMMIRCAKICIAYGLDVSLWYPNEGRDYESPEGIERELAQREEIFRSLPRLDALFIPGGDSERLEVNPLFKWGEKVARVLRKYHSTAKVGISPQGLRVTREWLGGFYARLREEPDWLDFVVFAPWERDPLPVLRERVPQRYPIRHYPDITHTFICQYPVPLWDPAFAHTEGRECINPRPRAMKHIHNLMSPYVMGSVIYSEGVNDDVNKFVWSDQDWDPSTPVEETLRQYVRLFVDPTNEAELVEALLALERNWEGPLADNESVEKTVALWLRLEAVADQQVKNNWRFQQGLLRACFDACVRRRSLREREAERRVWEILRYASSSSVLDQAEQILQEARNDKAQVTKTRSAELAPNDSELGGCEPLQTPSEETLKRRCFELADALWQNIGEQLSTKRHHASRTDRGAFLDTITVPLNDHEWLLEQFERIRHIPGEVDRLHTIGKLVERFNPGPDNYYDNFSHPVSWQRVDPGEGWEKDPGFYRTPLLTFWGNVKRQAWQSTLWSHYDMPITLRYSGLSAGPHLLRVAYAPGPWGYHVRLETGEGHLIHDYLEVRGSCRVCEFFLPPNLTSHSRLDLTWTTMDGELGPRIGEVWLIRTASR